MIDRMTTIYLSEARLITNILGNSKVLREITREYSLDDLDRIYKFKARLEHEVAKAECREMVWKMKKEGIV